MDRTEKTSPLEAHSVRKCASVIFAYRRVILLRSDIRLCRVIFGYAEFYGEYNITKAGGFYITFAVRQKYHCKLLVCNITFTHRKRNIIFGKYLLFSKYVTHYDTFCLKVSIFI